MLKDNKRIKIVSKITGVELFINPKGHTITGMPVKGVEDEFCEEL